MTLIGLGGRSDDGLGETLVLAHAFGQLHTTYLAAAVLIVTPCRTGKYTADNHFYTKSLALQTYGNHGVWGSELPVGTDVLGLVQELGSYLVQHLSLEGYALGQNYIKGRDTVGSHHYHQVVVDVIHIPYLAMIHTLLSFKLEICFR